MDPSVAADTAGTYESCGGAAGSTCSGAVNDGGGFGFSFSEKRQVSNPSTWQEFLLSALRLMTGL